MNKWHGDGRQSAVVGYNGEYARGVAAWICFEGESAMVPERLIEKLAADYWDDVNRYVPLVLPGGSDPEPCPDAAPSPIGEFIAAQEEIDCDRFLLPEPLLGPVDSRNLRVLVIGHYPEYDPDLDDEFRLGASSLRSYIAIYRDHLGYRDREGRIVRTRRGKMAPLVHLNWVEREMLTRPLGAQALGQFASYADAIPWSWNPSSRRQPDLNDPQVREYARDRVREIVEVLRPTVLLTLGEAAAETVEGWPDKWPADTASVRDVEIGTWSGKHLPALNPRSRSLARKEDREAYADAVSRALERAIDRA
jgi:hypothetical protein